MTPTGIEYVQQRLRTIQERHNFNPEIGVEQARAHPALIPAFARFDELRQLVERLELDVPILYDPAGLDPVSRQHAREATPTFVYFARAGHTNQWKIGYSASPPRRRSQLQTGNALTLHTRFILPGGYQLEQILLRYLSRYKVRGRSKEWHYLDISAIRTLIRLIRTQGPYFMINARLKLESP